MVPTSFTDWNPTVYPALSVRLDIYPTVCPLSVRLDIYPTVCSLSVRLDIYPTVCPLSVRLDIHLSLCPLSVLLNINPSLCPLSLWMGIKSTLCPLSIWRLPDPLPAYCLSRWITTGLSILYMFDYLSCIRLTMHMPDVLNVPLTLHPLIHASTRLSTRSASDNVSI